MRRYRHAAHERTARIFALCDPFHAGVRPFRPVQHHRRVFCGERAGRQRPRRRQYRLPDDGVHPGGGHGHRHGRGHPLLRQRRRRAQAARLLRRGGTPAPALRRAADGGIFALRAPFVARLRGERRHLRARRGIYGMDLVRGAAAGAGHRAFARHPQHGRGGVRHGGDDRRVCV